MLKKNRIYKCNCLKGLEYLSDECIDLTITSPPYDSIRNYDDKSEFDFKIFKQIAKELYRVTKQGGMIVWIIGDATTNGSESGTSFKHALYFKKVGFNLHDTMIYEKNSCTFPAKRKGNRYSQIFEYMFILSKGKPKTHSLICDKKNKWVGWVNWGKNTDRDKNGKLIEKPDIKPVPKFSPRNNIWKYSTGGGYSTKDKKAFKHPATFPEKLVKDHILSWSNENDLILDPFMGSGTTAKVCILTNRNFIGFEINQSYVKLARRRLKKLKK